MIMKTVNDKQFDVSLVTKFSKNDFRKTKACLDSLKPVIQKLQ